MTFTDHSITAAQVKLLIREGEGLTVEFTSDTMAICVSSARAISTMRRAAVA